MIYRLLVLIAVLLGLNPSLSYAEEPGAGMSETAKKATAATGTVGRALFTSDVIDREPVDQITTLTTNSSQIYFYTVLHNFTGRTMTHRWEYNGNFMSAHTFTVGGPRWRVWSRKTLTPEQTGTWKVTVVDENGNQFAEASFNYTQP